MAKKKQKVPQQVKNMRAATAGMAKATAGRARAFADKKDMLAANTGDSEINEGLEEYKEKQYQPAQDVLLLDVDIRIQVGILFPRGTAPVNNADALTAAAQKAAHEYLTESLTHGLPGVAAIMTKIHVSKHSDLGKK